MPMMRTGLFQVAIFGAGVHIKYITINDVTSVCNIGRVRTARFSSE